MKDLEPIDGIIFDLGKTLMYIPERYNLEGRIAKRVGLTRQKVEIFIYDLCYRNPNMSADEFVNLLCQKLGRNSHTLINTLREICWDSVKNAKLQNDAKGALKVLKGRGFKIALVSNTSPLSKSRIKKLDIKDYFDHIVLSCDIGYLKPDPRIFLHTIESMQTMPSNTCIVGDRIHTIMLGGFIIEARLILVERRMNHAVISEQIPVDAIVPNLEGLVKLPILGGT